MKWGDEAALISLLVFSFTTDFGSVEKLYVVEYCECTVKNKLLLLQENTVSQGATKKLFIYLIFF